MEEEKVVQNQELIDLYDQSMSDIKEGQVVKGTIIEVKKNDVLVDIGYKSEGILPMNEFDDPSAVKVGDEINVLLESKEDESGMIVLSHRKAERVQGWDNIVNNYNEGDTIEGRVTRKVKGGMMVNVGVEAFLPASLAALHGFANLDELVGQTVNFKIVKLNKARRNVVLSRKELLAQEETEKKGKLLDELAPGELRTGVVKNITDFGAFINLGGLDGLLHITDMSWGRISHPSELVAVGDNIEVKILDINKETKRVSLGLKQKSANPWEDVEEKYAVGSKAKGKVVNIVSYGAFVELEKGVEALIHISEVSWTKRIVHPSDVLAIGDVIEAVVLSVDRSSKKISLGIKQLEDNPWDNIAGKYTVGSRVEGKVRNLTEYGAFIELEGGIDGLIHINDLSWTKRVGNPKEVLKKGDKVEAVILEIDPENQKLSLGLKQAQPDPWPEIAGRYTADLACEGTISKVTNFGVFVELEKDLEGLIHVSETGLEEGMKLEQKFNPGDRLKVKVIKCDPEARKIALSAKDV